MKIVLVCIGNYQEYISHCVRQLLLWKNDDITILTDTLGLQEQLSQHLPKQVEVIHLPEEKCCGLGEQFECRSPLSHEFRQGFLRHCFKRFVYIYGYMKSFDVDNIVHIENDVMLYTNVDRLRSVFETDIHLIVDAETRCVPSFMYFKNHELIGECLRSHIDWRDPSANDMVFWAKCQKHHPDRITKLVITPFDDNYKENIGIFDGAAIGQYLGGVNPENLSDQNSYTKGFVNETCMVKYDQFAFSWKQEEASGLWRPVMVYDDNNKCAYINNLHVHSKHLENFVSRVSSVQDLEHDFCAVNINWNTEDYLNIIQHFVFFDYLPTHFKDNRWRLLRRPLWNWPTVCVPEKDWVRFMNNHHIYIKRPYVLFCLNHTTLPTMPEALNRPRCLAVFLTKAPLIDHPKLYLLPRLNPTFSGILRDITLQSSFEKEKTENIYRNDDGMFERRYDNLDSYKRFIEKLKTFRYCVVKDTSFDHYIVWELLALQTIPILSDSPYTNMVKRTVAPFPIFSTISDVVSNYKYPRYPIFDSELYKDKVRKLLN